MDGKGFLSGEAILVKLKPPIRNGFGIQLSPVLAQPCCWRVAPQQIPFPRLATPQNYYFFNEQRNNEKKQLYLHCHLRSTDLSELASDTLSETLPVTVAIAIYKGSIPVARRMLTVEEYCTD